jgi:hypothetical protein
MSYTHLTMEERNVLYKMLWLGYSKAEIARCLGRHRSGPKRQALESLRDYVGKRVAMTDYPTFRKLGYDCGSGPTESLCGRLTNRLKGPGMRWDRSNAEAMMALLSLHHSGLWGTYWKAKRAAA